MGKIIKIIVQEQNWNKISEKYETVLKMYDRETYKFDFDDLLLDEIPDYNVENYAENRLNMINEDNCECDIYNFRELEIISCLEDKGYGVVKCKSIVDHLRFDKIKEALNI